MHKFLRSGNTRLYLYLAVLVVMAIFWRTGEAINAKLAELPVKEAPKSGKSAVVLNEKSFYPVWVKQAVARAPVVDDTQVDLLFKREDEVEKKKADIKPIAPIEPDYGQMFREAIQIEGVADDGLFISGHFYAVGENMEPFAVTTAAGKRLVPKLVSLKNGKATFSLGALKMSIVSAEKP